MAAPQNYHIRLARGLKANLPSQGELGEPFFCTDTGELFVGQGQGLPLIQMVAGPTDSFVFVQSGATATWVIPHNLDGSPAIVVQDSTGTEVFVEKHFDSPNQATLYFANAESGQATCII